MLGSNHQHHQTAPTLDVLRCPEDLEECNQGYSLLQKQRPTGLGPPILRDFGHYMWGRMFEPDLRGCNSGRWIETGF